jgi:hypothetical protein
MFWIGFALGVVATVAFLIAEHVIGQLNRQQRTAFIKSFFNKRTAFWILNPSGSARINEHR